MPLSRGFLATLGGVALTLLAWFGSWVWPGWPASFALDVLGHFSSFPDLPSFAKVATVVMLIVINVGTWALVIRAAMQLLPRRGKG
ncbi:MAG: hypothetical protein QOC81_3139 [Thermoanaerobaculia bacterium]|jgi:hypothetical protein|nr:hypothetical protein [Thermoanaerobaculia bacterium]